MCTTVVRACVIQIYKRPVSGGVGEGRLQNYSSASAQVRTPNGPKKRSHTRTPGNVHNMYVRAKLSKIALKVWSVEVHT